MFSKKNQTILPKVPKKSLLTSITTINQLTQQVKNIRSQQYEEAHTIGQKILQIKPNNKTIQNFCKYIKTNLLVLQESSSENSESSSSSSSSESSDSQSQTQQSSESNESYKKNKKDNKIIIRKSSQNQNQRHFNQKLPTVKAQKGKQNKKNFKIRMKPHKWGHSCQNPKCPNLKKKKLL